jgi:hypothetical protein
MENFERRAKISRNAGNNLDNSSSFQVLLESTEVLL